MLNLLVALLQVPAGGFVMGRLPVALLADHQEPAAQRRAGDDQEGGCAAFDHPRGLRLWSSQGRCPSFITPNGTASGVPDDLLCRAGHIGLT